MFSEPRSEAEFNRREDERERRAEAIARHRRQQAELFELGAECPNCGEAGYEPVYGVSEDRSTGYSCDEQGCTKCLDSFIGRAR